MNKKIYFRRIADAAPILGACASILAMAAQLIDHWKISEAVIAGITLAATAFAGIASLYIARKAKSISPHKRIFISYSFDQREKAQRLREILIKRGAYVWLDVNDLRPGSELGASIRSAIENSNSMVALLPSEIGTNISMELSSAIARNVPVIAVRPSRFVSLGGFGENAKMLLLPADTDIEAIADKALESRAA